jgi:hypothetical protein
MTAGTEKHNTFAMSKGDKPDDMREIINNK